ncbi:hypothetical protein NSA52_03145 [Clostridium sporogenes]|uniref:hypothetical protein n=1 Tax=Clostridium sporogenes TaxID=1509 RepID=UPI00214A0F49|nr:hypothetical protein [Clostridium sporogenes]MCR1973127.1 hypothetical protein [Clostridium sporogenes]
MVPLGLLDFYSSNYRGDKLRKSPYDNSQVLSVINNADGRLEVFVIEKDNALWHIWQTAPNNGWSNWASMGGWIDQLVVGKNADGRLEVFARGKDYALWHIWKISPSDGWSSWASLGGVII